jgi:L-ribulose-5-phosphate 3-epimerase
LHRVVRTGADLGAEAVSMWSGGYPEAVPTDTAWDRLVGGRRRLRTAVGEPEGFGITLGIGHCPCLEPLPVPDRVADVAGHPVHVQIDDLRRGTHEHGVRRGEIDFPPIPAAPAAVGCRGPVAVELPRHSLAAPAVARRSLDFLRAAARLAPTQAGVAAETSTMTATKGVGR